MEEKNEIVREDNARRIIKNGRKKTGDLLQ